jgi:hypothetical protein
LLGELRTGQLAVAEGRGEGRSRKKHLHFFELRNTVATSKLLIEENGRGKGVRDAA